MTKRNSYYGGSTVLLNDISKGDILKQKIFISTQQKVEDQLKFDDEKRRSIFVSEKTDILLKEDRILRSQFVRFGRKRINDERWQIEREFESKIKDLSRQHGICVNFNGKKLSRVAQISSELDDDYNDLVILSDIVSFVHIHMESYFFVGFNNSGRVMNYKREYIFNT